MLRKMPKMPCNAAGRGRLGVISIEYVLILAGVVIPLALMVPTLMHVIALYSSRIVDVIALPFG